MHFTFSFYFANEYNKKKFKVNTLGTVGIEVSLPYKCVLCNSFLSKSFFDHAIRSYYDIRNFAEKTTQREKAFSSTGKFV